MCNIWTASMPICNIGDKESKNQYVTSTELEKDTRKVHTMYHTCQYVTYIGWDGIKYRYWCRHRSKICSKAHHLPSTALPPLWSVGLFQEANSPTVSCVQTSSHRPERPTILQYSDLEKEVAWIHGRRKLLDSTEGRSCSSPRKEKSAQVHGRRKMLEPTEGRSCSSPRKEEATWIHRQTRGGNSSP